MSTTTKTAERDQALATLREDVQPGDTLWTVVRHVTSSGMTRWIDVYKLVDGDRVYLSHAAAHATGRKVNNRNHDGVECGGCGMDMGFDLVYSVSRAMFPDGFDCIGDGCPSNDHSNDRGARNYSPDRHHTDGGYALKQRWL